jgi:hypothetical protein
MTTHNSFNSSHLLGAASIEVSQGQPRNRLGKTLLCMMQNTLRALTGTCGQFSTAAASAAAASADAGAAVDNDGKDSSTLNCVMTAVFGSPVSDWLDVSYLRSLNAETLAPNCPGGMAATSLKETCHPKSSVFARERVQLLRSLLHSPVASILHDTAVLQFVRAIWSTVDQDGSTPGESVGDFTAAAAACARICRGGPAPNSANTRVLNLAWRIHVETHPNLQSTKSTQERMPLWKYVLNAETRFVDYGFSNTDLGSCCVFFMCCLFCL